MSDAIHHPPPKLFRNIVPQSCRHPLTWPGQFGPVCMRVVPWNMCRRSIIAFGQHAAQITDSNIPVLSHTQSPQPFGLSVGSRYQVPEREPRVASAWNTRFNPTHQDSVWLHYSLSIASFNDWDDC